MAKKKPHKQEELTPEQQRIKSEAKRLIDYFIEHLPKKPEFVSNWFARNTVICKRLLKDYSFEDCKLMVDAIFKDNYWKNKIDGFEPIKKFSFRWLRLEKKEGNKMSNEIEITCPTCGSINEDSNTFTINDKEYICPCSEQKEKAKLYGKERANIPREYWYLKIENYQGDMDALNEIKEYLKYIDNYYKKNIGLFLFGPHGVGKTLLAVYILKEAIKKGYKSVRFTCLSDIISQFTASWFSDDEKKEFYNKMMETQFLVIDDVGKEFKSSKNNLTESVFDKILRYRDHPTIITSNKVSEHIETSYGESIGSLMSGKLISVSFKGTDFRKKSMAKSLKEMGKADSRVELIV